MVHQNNLSDEYVKKTLYNIQKAFKSKNKKKKKNGCPDITVPHNIDQEIVSISDTESDISPNIKKGPELNALNKCSDYRNMSSSDHDSSIKTITYSNTIDNSDDNKVSSVNNNTTSDYTIFTIILNSLIKSLKYLFIIIVSGLMSIVVYHIVYKGKRSFSDVFASIKNCKLLSKF